MQVIRARQTAVGKSLGAQLWQRFPSAQLRSSAVELWEELIHLIRAIHSRATCIPVLKVTRPFEAFWRTAPGRGSRWRWRRLLTPHTPWGLGSGWAMPATITQDRVTCPTSTSEPIKEPATMSESWWLPSDLAVPWILVCRMQGIRICPL